LSDPCLGAYAIIPMMFRAKSSRCRSYAVRAAASCDMGGKVVQGAGVRF
jgi:hypothetical protein